MPGDDYDIDYDLSCPKCNHSPIHSRRCTNIHCEDGMIDESEEDFCTEGSVMVPCDECKGTGIERWCPKCGENLSGMHIEEENENEYYEDKD